MASLNTIWEKEAMTSGPQAPYVSVTGGTQTQPRSTHLSSLAFLCLLIYFYSIHYYDYFHASGSMCN